ncbi:hypothetical protein GCM10010988_12990 [Cnuibacter physcomitrellae]|uniref:Uncharacterized protein n=1 Tax=Cnuibacter physcomitrellae TaxID=1619308 RepID=A0A1X9LLN6_9MICO|nr:hypothetical protein [Cnuibacter physcomitrellae]ARJ06115.1 hypothetical protein B5808_13445 [Cnuibacter physcomitrellae]GGI37246.1 hypothetical protein GCM10010988_12990 [Cnuibacter physcomitrellae]
MRGYGDHGFWETVRDDRRANPRDPKARSVLFWFRVCQLLIGDISRPRAISIPAVIVYRAVTELVLGIELRPKTAVGPGLSIFHGFGLVVNDHAVLGRDVKLRNGVTIGHQYAGGPSPRLGEGVEVGANAAIIGDIDVGAHCIVGANAVLTKSLPPHAVAVGNPARIIRVNETH